MSVRFLALVALALSPIGAAQAETILFVGNSFTFGAGSAVEHYRPASVTDLNGGRVGGVPALFKRFADESGLDYAVSLETSGGKDLAWHWTERRALLDRRWDHVVLQDYSTLSPTRPGDASELIDSTRRFAGLFARSNPRVDISLVATWSRPDLTYPPSGVWHGRPITAMAADIARGYARARRAAPVVRRVLPVGAAFSCAIVSGVADPNPYDGTTDGQVDLWARDHYHASAAGYYLEALVVFAGVTGQDPRRLGRREKAAAELGLDPALAERLQRVARRAARKGCGTQ